jgi:hypothetical protein
MNLWAVLTPQKHRRQDGSQSGRHEQYQHEEKTAERMPASPPLNHEGQT